MKIRSSLFSSVVIILAFFILLAFPSICITGARYGLLLWYNQVLPVLLPFFIISSFIASQIHASPILTTISLGVLCGYPMGAKNINDYYIQGYFSKTTAKHLLVICSHASPMFLIGYVYTGMLKSQLPLAVFLVAIYWPAILYSIGMIFVIYRSKKQDFCYRDCHSAIISHPHSQMTLDTSIERSLNLILKIGCYIMIYSILCNLLMHFQHKMQESLTNIVLPIGTGLLEMTTGIATIASADYSFAVKCAIITGVAAFGGCSSISQIKSALKSSGIGIFYYSIIKFVFAVLSGLSIYLYIIGGN